MIEQSKTGLISGSVGAAKTATTKSKGKLLDAVFSELATAQTSAAGANKLKLTFADIIKPKQRNFGQQVKATATEAAGHETSATIPNFVLAQNPHFAQTVAVNSKIAADNVAVKSEINPAKAAGQNYSVRSARTQQPVEPAAPTAISSQSAQTSTERKTQTWRVEPEREQASSDVAQKTVLPKTDQDASQAKKIAEPASASSVVQQVKKEAAGESKIDEVMVRAGEGKAEQAITSNQVKPVPNTVTEQAIKGNPVKPVPNNVNENKVKQANSTGNDETAEPIKEIKHEAKTDKAQKDQKVERVEENPVPGQKSNSAITESHEQMTVSKQARAEQVAAETGQTPAPKFVESGGIVEQMVPITTNAAYSANRSENSPNASATRIAGHEQLAMPIQAAAAQPGSRIVVNLNPPDMGRVSIKFEKSDEGISGTLEIEKASTKDQLESAMPKLLQSLQDAGVSVKNIDLVVKEQPVGNNLYDFAWGQNNSGRGDAGESTADNKPNGSSESHNPAFSAPSQPDNYEYIGEQSVNVWV